jgi:hypothetical protein
LDARIPLETEDGATIIMSFRGVRSVQADVAARMAAGATVDPNEYYFRINVLFHTTASKYEWLNRIVAIGTGQRLSTGPIYNVFALE